VVFYLQKNIENSEAIFKIIQLFLLKKLFELFFFLLMNLFHGYIPLFKTFMK